MGWFHHKLRIILVMVSKSTPHDQAALANAPATPVLSSGEVGDGGLDLKDVKARTQGSSSSHQQRRSPPTRFEWKAVER